MMNQMNLIIMMNMMIYMKLIRTLNFFIVHYLYGLLCILLLLQSGNLCFVSHISLLQILPKSLHLDQTNILTLSLPLPLPKVFLRLPNMLWLIIVLVLIRPFLLLNYVEILNNSRSHNCWIIYPYILWLRKSMILLSKRRFLMIY